MGIQDLDASFIFLFEGLILGVIGAIVGVGLGIGLAVMFKEFAVKEDGSPVVPLTLDYGFILLSMGMRLLLPLLHQSFPLANHQN
jgi:lipoprotein-releasing system permease protein